MNEYLLALISFLAALIFSLGGVGAWYNFTTPADNEL